LVVGRKALVGAGHVTTPNLGGRKIFWAGGVAKYLNCLLLWQNLWVSKPRAVAKNYPLYRGLMWNFADEEFHCYIVYAVFKI